MPKPRALTPEQEFEVLARWQAASNRRGLIAELAREYRLTWPGMKGLVDRLVRETEIKDSRETLISRLSP
jgi:hypothetical protein